MQLKWRKKKKVPSDLLNQSSGFLNFRLPQKTPIKQLPTPWGRLKRGSSSIIRLRSYYSSSRLLTCVNWLAKLLNLTAASPETVARSLSTTGTQMLNCDPALQPPILIAPTCLHKLADRLRSSVKRNQINQIQPFLRRIKLNHLKLIFPTSWDFFVFGISTADLLVVQEYPKQQLKYSNIAT